MEKLEPIASQRGKGNGRPIFSPAKSDWAQKLNFLDLSIHVDVFQFQIGSFFMINLCLVVIATQFSETKRRETAKMKAERARFQSSSTLSSFTNSETTNCYRQIIRLISHMVRKAVKRTRRTYRTMRARHLEKKELDLLEQQSAGKLKNYNVMKNVSTHSMINTVDGKNSS